MKKSYSGTFTGTLDLRCVCGHKLLIDQLRPLSPKKCSIDGCSCKKCPSSKPKRGGPRSGAGRPPKGKEKRIGVLIDFEPGTLGNLDLLRGCVSRADYLEQLINSALKVYHPDSWTVTPLSPNSKTHK